ncbi:hypothetical protein MBH78_02710 [Oceanimonas sp. NS1]|nr:hypothetical protein [Oceanimonas sp. NS1]
MASLLAALLHLAVIAGGPDWYRFFGAGEQMAKLAEQSSWYPALLTLMISSPWPLPPYMLSRDRG